MAPKLSLEARMTIIELLRRGWSRVAIAKSLGVTEGSVRYHDRRRQEGKTDGRVGRQQHRLAALSTEVEAWLSAEPSRRERLNLGALHEFLVVEHGYSGSLRSVQTGFDPKKAFLPGIEKERRCLPSAGRLRIIVPTEGQSYTRSRERARGLWRVGDSFFSIPIGS